ncbi:MAG TPA: hypothetical protein VFY18_00135 [Candidatus Limnocylindrales bacterium]|nr:hypothetical protein [Candidatus Limnocylindrales bacterium]
MTRTRAISTLIAVGALVAVGCTAGPRTSPPAVQAASPMPTTAPSMPISVPTASPRVALPTTLRYLWVGETRAIPGLTPPAVQSGLDLAHSEMGVYAQATGRSILESAASLDGPDSLRFELDGDSAGCRSGDVGTYTFELSETGRALMLDAADDPCASRVAAISGDWVRANCPPPGWCLGDLDPGRHVSAGFNPWVPPQAWQYDYGRFSYVVPDGWQNFEDGGDGYALAKQDAPEGPDAVPAAAIRIWQDVLANAQTASCENARAPGVGHTPRAIATWLSSLPSLSTTKPKSVTIGGLKGFTLDVSMNRASKSTCPWMDGKPAATLFINSDPSSSFGWGIGLDGSMRLFLLDLGGGRTLLIDVEATDQPTWKALVADAMPVVESFQFIH